MQLVLGIIQALIKVLCVHDERANVYRQSLRCLACTVNVQLVWGIIQAEGYRVRMLEYSDFENV